MSELAKTLLLVEDEAILALITSNLLVKRGYEVIVARNGEEAIEKAHSYSKIDLILMDINLRRGIDGVETAEIILKERDLPVIFLSAHTDPEVVEKVERVVSYGYVVKGSGESILDATIKLAFKLHALKRSLDERENALKQALVDPKKSEAAASESDPPFNLLWKEAPAALGWYDEQENLRAANPAYLEVFGAGSVEDLKGFEPFKNPDLSQDFKEELLRGEKVRFETTVDFDQVQQMGLYRTRKTGLAHHRVMISPVHLQSAIQGYILQVQDITEHKEVEASLAQRLAAAETFFNNSVVMMCFADLNGNFLRLNGEWERVLGYSVTELEGARFLDLVHPDDLEATIGVMKKLGEQKPVYSFANRYRCKDGSYRWIEWNSTPYGDVILAAATDISERKQVESALRESDARLKRSQAIAHLGSWELDLIDDRLIWSDETYRIFGLLPQEFPATYQAFLDAIHPEDRAAVDNAYVSSLRDQRDSYEIEHRVIRKDTGEVRFVHERCGHIRDDSGQIVRSLGMVHDITERKRAAQVIHEGEERYRMLMDICPDPISVTRLDGQFITMNRAALEQIGYSSVEELQENGISVFDFIYEPDRERAFVNAQKVLETGLLKNLEYRLKPKEGEIFPVDLSVALIRNEDGSPGAFIGITHDISLRKKTEELQARLLSEKSILLKDLQHRIKNSLSLISSLIMLEETVSTQAETHKTLAELRGRVNSLAALYNILYDSADVRRVNLKPYFVRITDSLAQSYLNQRMGIEIQVNCQDLLVDSRQATPFGLILNELLTNALKYAFPDEGAGCVWVVLQQVGDVLSLEVSNNGVALPSDFDPLRSEGLGLQIVAMLTGQLGGGFSFENGDKVKFNVWAPVENGPSVGQE